IGEGDGPKIFTILIGNFGNILFAVSLTSFAALAVSDSSLPSNLKFISFENGGYPSSSRSCNSSLKKPMLSCSNANLYSDAQGYMFVQLPFLCGRPYPPFLQPELLTETFSLPLENLEFQGPNQLGLHPPG